MTSLDELFKATINVIAVHVSGLKKINTMDDQNAELAVLLGTVAGAINVLRMHLSLFPEYKPFATSSLTGMFEGLPPDRLRVFSMIGDLETVGLVSAKTN